MFILLQISCAGIVGFCLAVTVAVKWDELLRRGRPHHGAGTLIAARFRACYAEDKLFGSLLVGSSVFLFCDTVAIGLLSWWHTAELGLSYSECANDGTEGQALYDQSFLIGQASWLIIGLDAFGLLFLRWVVTEHSRRIPDWRLAVVAEAIVPGYLERREAEQKLRDSTINLEVTTDMSGRSMFGSSKALASTAGGTGDLSGFQAQYMAQQKPGGIYI